MSYPFDLNINNYSIKELEDLLELPKNYNLNTIEIKEQQLIDNISNSNIIDIALKSKTLSFINNVKNYLINNLNKNLNNNFNNVFGSQLIINSSNIQEQQRAQQQQEQEETPKPINLNFQDKTNKINLVGTILNPYSEHPVLQKQSIVSNEISGYNYNSTITNYVFNTQFRDNYFNTISSDCTFTLPLTIKNVISISLSACQFPNVIYGFSDSNQTNEIFIHEDGTNLEANVTIPEGNYNIDNFVKTLEDYINLQVCGIPISSTKTNYRFFVSYNPSTYLVSIENKFYTFSMNILRKTQIDLNCENQKYNDKLNVNNDNNIGDSCILPTQLFKTMGYIIGFREVLYYGKSSYTAESTFNNTYTSYVYFCLNEYSNTQQNTTYGMFPSSVIDNSILALIPITSQPFSTTFDNNSNFIYKTRVYGGPIDISKIQIKILNQYGTVADLHYRDFAFSLQVTTIYDITIPYTQSG